MSVYFTCCFTISNLFFCWSVISGNKPLVIKLTIFTFNLLYFLNGITHFLKLFIIILGILRWELGSWPTSSIEPGAVCPGSILLANQLVLILISLNLIMGSSKTCRWIRNSDGYLFNLNLPLTTLNLNPCGNYIVRTYLSAYIHV